MKRTIAIHIGIARACFLAGVLFVVPAMLTFSLGTPIGFGFTHREQDPPPSPPAVRLVPDSIDFGNQVARRTSATRRVTVKNTGGQPLNIDSVELGGDNINSFAIVNDACSGATLDPNRACIVEVNFTPTGTGGRNARLKFSDNALDSPQRLQLKGNGINSIDVAPF